MSKVLPFKRDANRSDAGPTAADELHALLAVYDPLIALLRETYDEGLDLLADNLVHSTVRCREALAAGLDDRNGPMLVKEMREGLREIPQTLRSMLPGLGPRLCESLEHKLGIQFSRY